LGLLVMKNIANYGKRGELRNVVIQMDIECTPCLLDSTLVHVYQLECAFDTALTRCCFKKYAAREAWRISKKRIYLAHSLYKSKLLGT